MKVRPATAEDIPAIAAIYGRSVLEEFASFEHTPPDTAEMLTRFTAIIEKGYPYLVAEIDGVVAGYSYASAHRPRPAYQNTVESTVYVAPDFWRNGIAAELMQELIQQCRSAKFRQMIAIVACQGDADLDEIASVQLHRKLGFVDSGRLKGVGFKQGLWLDTVLLQMSL
ncbi:MAG: N-acetyltransferase family protein [Rhizobiaceae bacterium]